MSRANWAGIVVAVAGLALAAWLFRYDVSGNGSYAYVLDRWTGDAWLCVTSLECDPVIRPAQK